MFEVLGVVLILMIVGALVVRYVLRVLTGAEKGCSACPGCAETRDDNINQDLRRCACSATAADEDAGHE